MPKIETISPAMAYPLKGFPFFDEMASTDRETAAAYQQGDNAQDKGSCSHGINRRPAHSLLSLKVCVLQVRIWYIWALHILHILVLHVGILEIRVLVWIKIPASCRGNIGKLLVLP